MLEFCSIGHDQICYETGYCPACAFKDELLKKLDELQEENARLTIELDDMQTIMDAEEMEWNLKQTKPSQS